MCVRVSMRIFTSVHALTYIHVHTRVCVCVFTFVREFGRAREIASESIENAETLDWELVELAFRSSSVVAPIVSNKILNKENHFVDCTMSFLFMLSLKL